MIANVGHFKEIFVEPGIPKGLLKQGFMGPGGAGRHHDAIELLLFDDLFHLVLGVLGAGEKIFFNKVDTGQGAGIFRHLRDIDDAADVGPAVAHKDTNARFLGRDVLFRGVGPFLDQCPPGG